MPPTSSDTSRNLFTQFLSAKTIGLVAISLPCLVSVGFRQAGARPTDSTAKVDRPALMFDQYAVNLGKVPAAKIVQARFGFRNAGTEPVTITELKPSCGCLQPKIEKTQYAPGETGTFYLRSDAATQESGPQEYWLTVKYEDPKPRETKLLFKLELPERRVTITPRALTFYQFSSQSTTQTFTVNDFRAKPLTVLNATCKTSHVEVQVQQVDSGQKVAGPQAKISVTVAGDVPPGIHEHVVKVETNDDVYPTLWIPIQVVGKPEMAKTGRTAKKSHSTQQ
ncbi:DUF1573 domain-containing protein [Thalassoroseus pseudoceratinae]|uniref:DUF1573 domain-containing protein n=1 Tax=Thalassoroseus pseudoceratinae TaxID=2713176 RepID=UPI001420B1C8|nr:DUF1573 domain-containing protein [Thalassoroseus pseudoceratinae]